MDVINIEMANQGLSYRVGIVEHITGGDGNQMGARSCPRLSATNSLDMILFPLLRGATTGPVMPYRSSVD
jgi:hypothetical protein